MKSINNKIYIYTRNINYSYIKIKIVNTSISVIKKFKKFMKKKKEEDKVFIKIQQIS